MKTLLENEKFKVIRNNGQIDIFMIGHSESLMTFTIDSHDNRITATRFSFDKLNENDQRQVVECICRVLKEKCGGKEFVIITNPEHIKYAALFSNTHFKMDLRLIEGRIRLTSPEKLLTSLESTVINSEIQKIEDNGEFLFIVDKLLAKRHAELMNLAKISGFIESKIKDYEQKGVVGFEVMALSSVLMRLVNKKGELVAFYRVADLGNKVGYMCDTWVDEKFFGTKDKALGTAYIYKKACEVALNYRFDHLLLIAPKDRVDEFDKHFGCVLPQNSATNMPFILAGFDSAKPELTNTYQEQADFVISRYKQKNLQPSADILATSLSKITLSDSSLSSAQEVKSETRERSDTTETQFAKAMKKYSL